MGGLMYKILGGRWGEMNIKHVQLPSPDEVLVVVRVATLRRKTVIYCNSFI